MRIQTFKRKFYTQALEGISKLRPLKSVYIPRQIKKPWGSKVLVLSPHMDDEIIGCAGALCRHKKEQDSISILYFGDGRNKDCPKNNPGIAEIRKEEAKRASRILGIEDLTFLDMPEDRFSPTREDAKRLMDVFERVKPNLIYLPWFLDGHADHISVNKLLLKILRNKRISFNCCGYEVWTPLIPNILVDITECASVKMEALKQYGSQIEITDYSRTALGLNCYRTITSMHGKGYAEAFIYLDGKSYLGLIERYLVGGRSRRAGLL